MAEELFTIRLEEAAGAGGTLPSQTPLPTTAGDWQGAVSQIQAQMDHWMDLFSAWLRESMQRMGSLPAGAPAVVPGTLPGGPGLVAPLPPRAEAGDEDRSFLERLGSLLESLGIRDLGRILADLGRMIHPPQERFPWREGEGPPRVMDYDASRLPTQAGRPGESREMPWRMESPFRGRESEPTGYDLGKRVMPEEPQSAELPFTGKATPGLEAAGEGAAVGGGEIAAAGEGLAAAGGPIGIAVAVVVAEFALAAVAIQKFNQVVDSFVQRGRELAPYSGPLTGATAQADIRSLQADIREAQTTGPDLARLIDAQSQASTELRELLLPIKRFVIEVLADILEQALVKIREAREDIAVIKELQATLVNLMNDVFGAGHIADIPALLQGMPKRIQDALRAIRDEDKAGEGYGIGQLWQLMNQVGGMGPPNLPAPAQQQLQQLQQGLNGPVFGGGF